MTKVAEVILLGLLAQSVSTSPQAAFLTGVSIEVPARLYVERNGNALAVSVTQRGYVSLAEVLATPLGEVNGYPDRWRDLTGYLGFIGQTPKIRQVSGREFGVLEGEIDATYIYISRACFVQATFMTGGLASDYRDAVLTMAESLRLELRLRPSDDTAGPCPAPHNRQAER